MLDKAREVLKIEAEAILSLVPKIDQDFVQAIELILACKGRVVVTGMGKSGIIGRKISATLASTGTPSFFLHPAEGIHGDLGMVTVNDVVLALSNSGETAEVLQILPSIRRIGARVISMCGNQNSTLAKNADIALDVSIAQEACPLGLAPTASTTASLAYGDALAVALLAKRKFTADDFAIFHPGGSLGRKLLLTVADIMHAGEEVPIIAQDKIVQEALFVITSKGLGATVVVDEQGKMVGVLTDGDIRRGSEKGLEFLKQPIVHFMTRAPKTIKAERLAAEALHIMEKNKPRPITVLPVVDENNYVLGMLHMTDLLRQGVV